MTNELVRSSPIDEPRNVAEWVSVITEVFQASVECMILTGRRLEEAKLDLNHGEFLDMIENKLPFSARTAQKFMQIGRSIRLSNATHAARLPPHLDTLCEIVRLEEDQFKARLADGTICPDMKRVDLSLARKQLARAARERALGAAQRSLPNKRFGVILADPEWQFAVWGKGGMDRAADNHYPTSKLETIMAREVSEIAARDCVLFLWTTVPMLSCGAAHHVIHAWGFEGKTQIVWVKDRGGTGYWFQNWHEVLMVATRGEPPAPAPGTQWRSVIEGPVRAHSQKPEWQYELIETFFPTLPKIELNARQRRPGWDSWGNEIAEAAE